MTDYTVKEACLALGNITQPTLFRWARDAGIAPTRGEGDKRERLYTAEQLNFLAKKHNLTLLVEKKDVNISQESHHFLTEQEDLVLLSRKQALEILDLQRRIETIERQLQKNSPLWKIPRNGLSSIQPLPADTSSQKAIQHDNNGEVKVGEVAEVHGIKRARALQQARGGRIGATDRGTPKKQQWMLAESQLLKILTFWKEISPETFQICSDSKCPCQSIS